MRVHRRDVHGIIAHNYFKKEARRESERAAAAGKPWKTPEGRFTCPAKNCGATFETINDRDIHCQESDKIFSGLSVVTTRW